MRTCAICGQPIMHKGNVDHFIPRAVYKWLKNYLPKEEYMELKETINSKDNRMRTHVGCNKAKEDRLLTIDELHISEEKKEAIRDLVKKIEGSITEYQRQKDEILRNQKGLCYCCNKPIEDSQVLRRIHPGKKRTWKNACIVCHDCNVKEERFSTKKKRW